jgi:hypothetical protein
MVTREHVDGDTLTPQTIKDPGTPRVPNLKIDKFSTVNHITQMNYCGNLVFLDVGEEDILIEPVKIFIDVGILTTRTEVGVIYKSYFHGLITTWVSMIQSIRWRLSWIAVSVSSILANRASNSVGSNADRCGF